MRGSGVTSQGVGVGIGGVRSSVGDKMCSGNRRRNGVLDGELHCRYRYISHSHFGKDRVHSHVLLLAARFHTTCLS